MTSLADLLDPDQWMVSGKNLLDFPWPDGNNEREAMKLIFSTRPLLNAHFEQWSKRVMEALGRRGGEKVGDVFMEEYLRERLRRVETPRLAISIRPRRSLAQDQNPASTAVKREAEEEWR